jgi:hypothetical protein
MFSTMAAVFVEHEFVFVFNFVFGRQIVPVFADRADQTQFDGDVFF